MRKTQQNRYKRIKTRKTRKLRGGGEISIEIEDIIDNLNNKIQHRCPNLLIKLDYKEKLPGKIITYYGSDKPQNIVLCLYNTQYEEEECFSSIEYKVDETDKNILYITSKTKDNEQGKKYNTLMRACSIVLANKWGFKQIMSNAENPISVWLLTKDYEYKTDYDFNKFINNRKITKKIINDYFDEDPEFTYVDIYVVINKDNIKRAYDLIENTPFICNKYEV